MIWLANEVIELEIRNVRWDNAASCEQARQKHLMRAFLVNNDFHP